VIILTPIDRETLQVFFKESPRAELPSFAARKQQYHRCCGSGRPWYADTRVGWNGLSYRCLPYNQKWIHGAPVKYVKKKKNTWWDFLYFSVIKCCIRCEFFKYFTDLWITGYSLYSVEVETCLKQRIHYCRLRMPRMIWRSIHFWFSIPNMLT
jgi:hypothetical protein